MTTTQTEQPALPPVADHPLVPRRLTIESHPLSDEQQAIATSVIVDGGDVVVRAKAGSGKTTLLVALANRFLFAEHQDPTREKARILYLAFNSSVQKEAEQRMPRNVETRTGHSLAWRWAGPAFTAKVKFDPRAVRSLGPRAEQEAKFLRSRERAVANALGLGRGMGPKGKITAPKQAGLIKAMVDRFASSADDTIGPQHFRMPDGTNLAAGLNPAERALLMQHANTYWDDIATPLGSGTCRFKATFDHLRKVWALARPDLTTGDFGSNPANVLFLDEAQDTPPVLARVVDDQRDRMRRGVVGDPEQAVYGFTGALDALDHFGITASFPLTTSYRFGPNIASVANRFLDILDAKERVVGHLPGDVIGPVSAPDAVLTRTNLAMLTGIIEAQQAGRAVGVLTSTKDDLALLVATARAMKDETALPDSPHEILARYSTWQAFKDAGADTPDVQVRTAYEMLKANGIRGLKKVVDALIGVEDTAALTRNARVDVMFVTAHKAKGLEWDAVRIGDDFAGPRWDKRRNAFLLPADEELRLAYVAVTRAKTRLDPGSLDWIFEDDLLEVCERA